MNFHKYFFQEITLRKSDSNERLGLIVCYNSCASNGNSGEHNGAFSSFDDNDACTEVYISGIQPDSVAGRDGRLRQGDQILQINGKDIKNKEETELLIAENNNAVTLLVSRYLFTVILYYLLCLYNSNLTRTDKKNTHFHKF